MTRKEIEAECLRIAKAINDPNITEESLKARNNIQLNIIHLHLCIESRKMIRENNLK